MGRAHTMVYRFVDGICIMVNTVTAPSDDEWNHHCKELETVHASLRGVLVFTAGGGPTSKQRERLRAAVPSSIPPTAIMTDSALVRGIITSINWFVNNPLSAFDHDDLKGALRHIARGGATVDPAKVVGTLRELANELSVKLPTTWPNFGA
ncbi:MAG TPA: hypothetical protein VMF89_14740 [Polyangiales bacterium]|nr:hypothetical protein [Polyangiales bacterium]